MLNTSGFIKSFNGIARHKNRYEVFRDFVTISAIAFHNAVNKIESLENEYLTIVGSYSKEDVTGFTKLLAQLTMLLENEPRDILGALFMDLEIGNKGTGQFFTPSEISQLMANLSFDEEVLKKSMIIKLSEPACGAGGMVLAFAKLLIEKGYNPAHSVFAECIDIDRTAALMCYLQLSLWNIPARIVVGNTLSMKFQEQFFTPAYYLNNWESKFKTESMVNRMSEFCRSLSKSNEMNTYEEVPEEKRSEPLTQLDLFGA